jgi:hypothetical protein
LIVRVVHQDFREPPTPGTFTPLAIIDFPGLELLFVLVLGWDVLTPPKDPWPGGLLGLWPLAI